MMAVMADPSMAQRKTLAKKGQAIPNKDSGGSYPVRNRAELKDAIQAVGRAGSPEDQAKVRRFIMKRARALDLSSMIPPNWNPDGTTKS